MVIQAEEIKAFLGQVVGSSGKGPSSLIHCRTDRNTQICTAKAYAAGFVDKSARQEVKEEINNPQVFIPGSDVRHRPSKEEEY